MVPSDKVVVECHCGRTIEGALNETIDCQCGCWGRLDYNENQIEPRTSINADCGGLRSVGDVRVRWVPARPDSR